MEVIDWSPDWGDGISSATGRLVVDGVRAAEVRPEAPSKGQITALMDLLDLHYAGVDAGSPVVPDRLMLRSPAPPRGPRGDRDTSAGIGGAEPTRSHGTRAGERRGMVTRGLRLGPVG